MSAGRDIEVIPGVTMGDIRYAAATAVYACRTSGSNNTDRYETAWSAIAEHVWVGRGQGPPPTRHDMVRTGMEAVDRAARGDYHHHGYRRGEDGGGVMKAAVAYWWDLSLPVPSPENAVVERLAVRQILPVLTPGQRDALLALATCGTYAETADALGITVKALYTRIAAGRGRFLGWWHEGESPPHIWRRDRRGGKAAGNERRDLRAAVTSKAVRRAPPHGANRYGNHGCRCHVCTAAYVARQKAYRRSKGVKERPRITASRLAEIKADRDGGASVRWLAKKYRSSPRTISGLLRGEREPAPG